MGLIMERPGVNYEMAHGMSFIPWARGDYRRAGSDVTPMGLPMGCHMGLMSYEASYGISCGTSNGM